MGVGVTCEVREGGQGLHPKQVTGEAVDVPKARRRKDLWNTGEATLILSDRVGEG